MKNPDKRRRCKVCTKILKKGENGRYKVCVCSKPEPMTAKEIALRAKWAARTEDLPKAPRKHRGMIFFDVSKPYPKSPIDALNIVVPTVVDHALRCSFCGGPVSHMEATFGKGSRGMVFMANATVAADRILREHVSLHSERLVACPKDALKITKPVFSSLEEV